MFIFSIAMVIILITWTIAYVTVPAVYSIRVHGTLVIEWHPYCGLVLFNCSVDFSLPLILGFQPGLWRLFGPGNTPLISGKDHITFFTNESMPGIAYKRRRKG